MTRLLLDQGLSPRAAALLRQRGFDAAHVSEIGMDRADDAEILDRAGLDGSTCITLDRDFHAHLGADTKRAALGGVVAYPRH